VLHECLLLALENLVEVAIGHLVLELELLDLRAKCGALILHLVDCALNVTALILELLVGNGQLLERLLLLVELLYHLIDLRLKALGLILTAFAASAGHLALHLLNLELSIVQELLLSLLLLLKFDNVGLQVS
jgi:hypothetical protein